MKRIACVTLVAALSSVLPLELSGQEAPTDSAAIRATALDYIEGWYTGDGERMDRAVHPELAKRLVRHDTGELVQTTAEALIVSTARGAGARTPPAERRTDVEILDVYENAASVRVTAHQWVDYMHLARVDGEWRIVNVLWELSSEGKERMGRLRRERRGER